MKNYVVRDLTSGEEHVLPGSTPALDTNDIGFDYGACGAVLPADYDAPTLETLFATSAGLILLVRSNDEPANGSPGVMWWESLLLRPADTKDRSADR